MPKYQMTWTRNELIAQAESVEDMIEAHQAAIDKLKNMCSDKMEFNFENDIADDIIVGTNDPLLAEKYGLVDMTGKPEEYRDSLFAIMKRNKDKLIANKNKFV